MPIIDAPENTNFVFLSVCLMLPIGRENEQNQNKIQMQ